MCSHHPGGIARGRRGWHCLYFCTECGQWFVSASDLYAARVSAFLQTLSHNEENMATYRGTVKGRRSGCDSRLGDVGSGLRVTADTRDAGIRVLIERHKDGHDIAVVFITGGSNNPDRMRPVYQVDLTEEAANNQSDQD